MPEFTVPLTFRDKAAADDVAEAVAWADGYSETIPNPAYDPGDPTSNEPETIPNPKTKLQFALERVVGFLQSKKQAHDTYVESQANPSTPPDIGVILR